jgi:arylsulfatase A-like enzyme
VSLPVWLKRHGYSTAGFISAYALDRNRGFGRGFDTYSDKLRDNDPLYVFHYAHALIAFEALKRIPIPLLQNIPLGKRRFAHETTDKAMHWLERQDKDEPFFLFCHYFDTHCEYYSPNGFRSFPIRSNKKTLRQFEKGIRELTPSDRECIELQYDMSIKHVDSQVARLMNRLRNEDFSRDTLVIVTADHGEGLGDHNYMLHGCELYEEETHVPGIIHSVNNELPPVEIPDLLRSIDLCPTILSLADVPLYPTDGIDFSGVLDGDNLSDSLLAFTETRHTDLQAKVLRSIRSANFKYIFDDRGREEFYDMLEDPDEGKNIIDSHRTHADELLRMMQSELGMLLR